MLSSYTENSLVERPAIALLGELGWETANCFYETFGPKGTLGRETPYDVVLEPKLRAAFRNPFGIRPHLCPLPKGEEVCTGPAGGAINFAVEELTKQGLQGRKQG